MMISKKMAAKMGEQVTHEFAASQKYLAMACQFDGMALKVLAGFFRKQADEERTHALKFVDFLLEVGAPVTLAALSAPKSSYPSVKAAIAEALKSEETVTAQINELVSLADAEKDYASRAFLQWFVTEQVEEVSSMAHLLQITEMAGSNLLQLESYVRYILAGEKS